MSRMSRWVWVLGLVGACGGGGSDAGDADGVDTDSDTVPFDTDLCSEIRTYDLQSLSCDQLLSAFDDTMNDAGDCNVTADCQSLSGRCTEMLNECYYPVNSCVDASTVSAFVTEYGNCVGDDRCDCTSSPDVDCIGGRCQFVGTTR